MPGRGAPPFGAPVGMAIPGAAPFGAPVGMTIPGAAPFGGEPDDFRPGSHYAPLGASPPPTTGGFFRPPFGSM